MELDIFTSKELPFVLGALRKVALANDRFTEGEGALIEGVARLHGIDLVADQLAAVSFDEVARAVVEPHRRKRVVQLAIVMALVEGPPARTTEGVVRRLAQALDLDEEGLNVLYQMTHHRGLHARFDMLRRFGRTMAPAARSISPRATTYWRRATARSRRCGRSSGFRPCLRHPPSPPSTIGGASHLG
jgi:hypothetical protein